MRKCWKFREKRLKRTILIIKKKIKFFFFCTQFWSYHEIFADGRHCHLVIKAIYQYDEWEIRYVDKFALIFIVLGVDASSMNSYSSNLSPPSWLISIPAPHLDLTLTSTLISYLLSWFISISVLYCFECTWQEIYCHLRSELMLSTYPFLWPNSSLLSYVRKQGFCNITTLQNSLFFFV